MGINIKDIAKELGITAPTVSKALNDRPGVNSRLRAEIKKTAERMGYAPYMNARETGMYDKGIKTIAVVYSRVSQYFIEKLQRATDTIFYPKGYYELRYTIDVGNLLINEEIESELIFKKLLQDKRIAGILFAFLPTSDVLIAQFHKNGIPTVLLNNYTEYGKCVTINNEKAMYEIVNELIKLGHTKIGMIMPRENIEQVWMDRYRGYKRCLADHKINYDPNLIYHEWTFRIKESAYATKQLINNQPDITAIIYGSDIQAYGGLKALSDMKIKVPDDIAIVGFDDLDFNEVFKPSLSSVEQPIERMGEIGAKMLMNAIQKKDFSHEAVELDAEIHLRGSCLKNYKSSFWA